jgi:hypothetical protein
VQEVLSISTGKQERYPVLGKRLSSQSLSSRATQLVEEQETDSVVWMIYRKPRIVESVRSLRVGADLNWAVFHRLEKLELVESYIFEWTLVRRQ